MPFPEGTLVPRDGAGKKETPCVWDLILSLILILPAIAGCKVLFGRPARHRERSGEAGGSAEQKRLCVCACLRPSVANLHETAAAKISHISLNPFSKFLTNLYVSKSGVSERFTAIFSLTALSSEGSRASLTAKVSYSSKLFVMSSGSPMAVNMLDETLEAK
jgi:hypothetical protein